MPLAAMPMQVLKLAYAAALHRRSAAVSTLDVLIRVALYRGRTPPPWVLAGSLRNLRLLATDSPRPATPASRSRA